MRSLDRLWRLLRTAVGVFLDLLTFFRLILRTSQAVAAENLFLRKQLALYVERQTKPHRATDAVRFTLVLRKNWVGPSKSRRSNEFVESGDASANVQFLSCLDINS